ncbi:uncharacterized protein LOC143253964 [Tachypleus tridentatus]|uniref:uncharacterized protein LOC143253964 n=1 Tax=Tachypleus tridentatus TaxID=6853 RepID=UPI003FD31749
MSVLCYIFLSLPILVGVLGLLVSSVLYLPVYMIVCCRLRDQHLMLFGSWGMTHDLISLELSNSDSESQSFPLLENNLLSPSIVSLAWCKTGPLFLVLLGQSYFLCINIRRSMEKKLKKN